MAKNTTKKIKELKGIKPEKITDEQLTKVQNSVNEINKFQLEIGSLDVKKHELIYHVAGLRAQLSTLPQEFEKDYGTFDIDIATGTINYPKENGEVNS